MGNSPRDCGPGWQWLGFIFIWWGIVLMGSCPRILVKISIATHIGYIKLSISRNYTL